MNEFKKAWELYTESWKRTKLSERLGLFKKCVAEDCVYTDPLVVTNGWDELVQYMEQFHLQIPDGHFEIVDFQSHHNFSLAQWKMLDQNGIKIGEGHSVGKYNEKGLLIQVTGFYKL